MNRTKRSAVEAARWAAVGLFVVYLGCGCDRGAASGGRDLSNIEVRPVTLYGVTLDESASPEEVAFAALQAIRDDYLAPTAAKREEALDAQFDLAAANVILERKQVRMEAEEFLYDVVYHWTPTVSYYVADFPETLDEARSRLVRRVETPTDVELAMELADPGGDPRARVVMLVWLARDKELWRVLHFGFDRRRSLGGTAGADRRDVSVAPQG